MFRLLFRGFNFRGLPVNRENRENWIPRKFPAIRYIHCVNDYESATDPEGTQEAMTSSGTDDKYTGKYNENEREQDAEEYLVNWFSSSYIVYCYCPIE